MKIEIETTDNSITIHTNTEEEMMDMLKKIMTKTTIRVMTPIKRIQPIKRRKSKLRKCNWSNDEIRLLKQLVDRRKTNKQISKILNRSEDAVRTKYNRLFKEPITKTNKVRLKSHHLKWSNEEDKLLKSLFEEGHSEEEISKKLGRSINSVKWRLRLGGYHLKKSDKPKLTEMEEKVKNYYNMGLKIREISEETGLTYMGVYNKISKLLYNGHMDKRSKSERGVTL